MKELSYENLLPKSAGGDTRSDHAARAAWSNYAIAERIGVDERTVRRARAEELASRGWLVELSRAHVSQNSGENEWYTPSAIHRGGAPVHGRHRSRPRVKRQCARDSSGGSILHPGNRRALAAMGRPRLAESAL